MRRASARSSQFIGSESTEERYHVCSRAAAAAIGYRLAGKIHSRREKGPAEGGGEKERQKDRQTDR